MVNACKKCASGYIMTALPNNNGGAEAAATCTVCLTNSTNDAITDAITTQQTCNKCLIGYYMTTAATAAPAAAACT